MQEKSDKSHNIKSRILQYIENQNIGITDFYKKSGISYGILSQNTKMSEDNIVRMLTCFSDLSPEWLLLGRGSMLKNQPKTGQYIAGDNNKLEEKKECDLCKEKDKVIKSLEKQIELLERIAKMEDKG